MLGRTYPEEVLSRVLYATQFTRHLDRNGYVRFRNWRFFGENGLARAEVSVWVYEGTLKIEYQATALSLYALTFQPDHEQIAKVTNPRRIETHFRSPQLDLVATLRYGVAPCSTAARIRHAEETEQDGYSCRAAPAS
jgi:hypothetical protein